MENLLEQTLINFKHLIKINPSFFEGFFYIRFINLKSI
jgi:hypothetical protein